MEKKVLYKSGENKSPRMFKNDFIDYFSRIHPMVIPVIYIPIIGYFIYQSIFVFEVGYLSFLGLTLGGIVFWTLFEYLLHRYFFHYEFKGKIGQRIHFIAHGVHHDYPNDHLRLVIPPAVSLSLAVALYWIFYLIFQDKGITASFYSGFMLGYLVYDMMHYATHYSKYRGKWFLKIKKNHMDHHYKNHDRGFGLSSTFWDIIFKTTHKK